MRKIITLAFLFIVSSAWQVFSFPTWMGVYGSYQRYSGSNPGTFTILCNQDYYGLHAGVGIQIDNEPWEFYQMDYSGNVDGNSIWTYTPTVSFPGGSTVTFYFHAWDNWGGQMWDSNWGGNYGFGNPYTFMGWLGNTWHFPTNGVITATNELHMLTESWPTGAGSHGEIVYSPDGDDNWYSTPLMYDSVIENNDLWIVNVGAFSAGQTIKYAIKMVDMEGNERWDNNQGQDYTVEINPDPNDLDSDGLLDAWEVQHGLDPNDATGVNGGEGDYDGDGFTNAEEYAAGANPTKFDVAPQITITSPR